VMTLSGWTMDGGWMMTLSDGWTMDDGWML
jgi:hypothetical protein